MTRRRSFVNGRRPLASRKSSTRPLARLTLVRTFSRREVSTVKMSWRKRCVMRWDLTPLRRGMITCVNVRGRVIQLAIWHRRRISLVMALPRATRTQFRNRATAKPQIRRQMVHRLTCKIMVLVKSLRNVPFLKTKSRRTPPLRRQAFPLRLLLYASFTLVSLSPQIPPTSRSR